MATALAVRGAVVILADWREAPAFGGGNPASFEDVACAIAFARKLAPEYGANGARVALIGHSFGGFAGAVVALSAKPFAPRRNDCLAAGLSARPDSYVGIAPVSTLDNIGGDFLPTFFGGTREQRPAAWDAADPMMLASAPKVQLPSVFLVVGDSDPTVPPATVIPLANALRAAGHIVTWTTITGATHDDILVRPETIAAVLAAAGP